MKMFFMILKCYSIFFILKSFYNKFGLFYLKNDFNCNLLKLFINNIKIFVSKLKFKSYLYKIMIQ